MANAIKPIWLSQKCKDYICYKLEEYRRKTGKNKPLGVIAEELIQKAEGRKYDEFKEK
jgi:hypothetical protein